MHGSSDGQSGWICCLTWLVEIFGEHIPLSQMAKELDTIPYEIVCLISERVERIYEPVLDKIYVSQ